MGDWRHQKTWRSQETQKVLNNTKKIGWCFFGKICWWIFGKGLNFQRFVEWFGIKAKTFVGLWSMNDMCWVQVGSCFSGSCCRLWPYFWCRAHQPIKSEIRGMGATEASDISRRSTCSGNPEEVPACQKSDKKRHNRSACQRHQVVSN